MVFEHVELNDPKHEHHLGEGYDGDPADGHGDQDEDDNQGPARPLQLRSARCFLRIMIHEIFVS